MDNLTRTRQERILALDRQLREGKYPNCASFAEFWRERFGYGRSLDRRTILRDIEYLRNMHNAPIEFDARRKGYCYTDASWPLPPFLTVSRSEMANLLMAWRAMALYRETPLAKNLGALFEKLSTAIADELDPGGDRLETKFSFFSSPARPVEPEIWQTVFDALRTCRVLEIEYRRPDGEDAENAAGASRRVRPLHLANIDGEWYLAAFCLARNDCRQFALSRIRSARDTGEEFDTPEDFDPAAFYANRFAKFLGPTDSRPARVTVRFTPEAAPWALEREWHPGQKVAREKDGGLRLTLPMPSLFEAKRWVLAWGADAEVLAPPSLRLDVKEEIARLGAQYGVFEEE